MVLEFAFSAPVPASTTVAKVYVENLHIGCTRFDYWLPKLIITFLPFPNPSSRLSANHSSKLKRMTRGGRSTVVGLPSLPFRISVRFYFTNMYFLNGTHRLFSKRLLMNSSLDSLCFLKLSSLSQALNTFSLVSPEDDWTAQRTATVQIWTVSRAQEGSSTSHKPTLTGSLLSTFSQTLLAAAGSHHFFIRVRKGTGVVIDLHSAIGALCYHLFLFQSLIALFFRNH